MRWPWQKSVRELERSEQTALGLDEWISLFSQFGYQGLQYTLPGQPQEEVVGGSFRSLTGGAYKSDSVVFACMTVRMRVFSQARFQFRQIRSGQPGKLFGSDALTPLEKPAPGLTTGAMLARAVQDADLAGNWFGTNRFGGVARLRPDWVSLIIGSNQTSDALQWDPDAQVVGYKYQPGGVGSGRDPVFFLAEEVAHFAPVPDPEAQFRGMSWLTPVVREVMADKAATEHKLRFFENGATPNLVVKMDVSDVTKFQEWIKLFGEQHDGAANAYKTLYLGAGMDATVVGADLQQLDFKATQGAGETRIAAAAGVPPVIVGLSEGLQGSSLNAGNYQSARRAFADLTLRDLWAKMAGACANLVKVPASSELWYDDRDIAFLQDDQLDAAEIQAKQAQTIRTLVDGGYEPDTVVDAVIAGDFSRLKHTELFSVQLQPPGTTASPPEPDPALNGNNSQRALDALALLTQED